MRRFVPIVLLAIAPSVSAQPYDFSDAAALLNAELTDLDGHVAVIVRQDGVELFRFQAGDIGYDTKTRLASFTKTISAGVVLAAADDGLIAMDETLGAAMPLFQANGIGAPTVIDCFGMRHGIGTPLPYEIDRRYTLAQSVTLIGLNGELVFPPGSQLGYDGSGMQSVGRIVEIRAGVPWEQFARTRIFDRCGMPQADYEQFNPNPAIAGGARSSASETINYAQMLIDRGWYAGSRVLSDVAVERLFTNATRGLPVYATPFPPTHPLYPYGQDPDYAFGCWVLAENPASGHVEEVVGAGAWGSFIWIDRRRGLTAVLITDVPAGSQASLDAALGLFDIARRQTESHQAQGLTALRDGDGVRLDWATPSGATASRVYGSDAPIRDVFALRDAAFLGVLNSGTVVPAYDHYAVMGTFGQFENTALIPGENVAELPCDADVNCDGVPDQGDVACVILAVAGDMSCFCQTDPDFNRDGVPDQGDVADVILTVAGAPCP